MRVIRTEMYFDPRDLVWPEVEDMFGNPGISVAFFGMKTDGSELSELRIHSILSNGRRVDDQIIRAFVDRSLRNVRYGIFGAFDLEVGAETNPDIVTYVLEQTVLIEQSPAEGIPFSSLIKGASVATIGTYVGMQAADGNPLLFLTVPAGIIAVGSALAISNAINKGLNKAIERISKRKTRRR